MSRFGARPRGGVFAAPPGGKAGVGARCAEGRCYDGILEGEFLGCAKGNGRAYGYYGLSSDGVVNVVVSARIRPGWSIVDALAFSFAVPACQPGQARGLAPLSPAGPTARP